MHHSLRTALLLAAPVLLLSACKKDDEKPIEAVVPLAVGNRWEYKLYRYTPIGLLLDSSNTFTRTIVKDTLIKKATWYITSDRQIVRNESGGYVHYNASGDATVLFSRTRNTAQYGYTYPNYTLWVKSLKNEVLEPVPGSRARYSAYRYDVEYQYDYPGVATPSLQKREQYVAPGIGMVREDVYYRDVPTVLQYRYELTRYQVN